MQLVECAALLASLDTICLRGIRHKSREHESVYGVGGYGQGGELLFFFSIYFCHFFYAVTFPRLEVGWAALDWEWAGLG